MVFRLSDSSASQCIDPRSTAFLATWTFGEMSDNVYIAVHGGAGFHERKYGKEIKHALQRACNVALSNLGSKHSSALTMVEDAISSLEDDEHLNAGYGSNLTLDGTVECDAAIMSGKSGCFGSVGAVAGVKNPIRLARAVLDHSSIPSPIGRIPPLTLVSEGARQFALSQPSSAHLVSRESLVSPQAEERWRVWKCRFASSDPSSLSGNLNDIQDTVGAVAWHESDGMAAGVSSGGLLLKYPGRIGEAAVFGAGCWAQEASDVEQGMEMACSISGTGEYIIRAMLARRLGEAFEKGAGNSDGDDPHEVLHGVLNDQFWNMRRGRGEPDPSVGVLLLTRENDGRARLWCAFTTPTMAIAYVSSKNPKAKAIILRRPQNITLGDDKPCIYITGISL